jgi:hypothetical protein
MSSTAAEQRACPFCAVEVRDGALFCFNCGKPLGFEAGTDEEAASLSEVAEQPTVESEVGPDVSEPAPQALAEQVEPAPSGGDAVATPKRPPSPRRRQRPVPKREVEMVWADPDDNRGRQLFLGAVAVALVSLVLILLSVYVR